MTLYLEQDLRPSSFNFITAELDVYETDEENYVPYESPYNTLGTGGSLLKEEDEDSESEEESEEESTDETSTDEETTEDTGYTLHLGEILETYTFDNLYSAEWSKDYTEWSGEATIKLPYHKQDLKHLYKGVRCLLKINRFDYGTDVEELRNLDTEGYAKAYEEMLLEVEKQKQELQTKINTIEDSITEYIETGGATEITDGTSDGNEDYSEETPHKVLNDILVDYDFYIQHSYLCFITDIKFSMEGTELSLSSYEVCLEREDQMAFEQMYRSDIIREVIRTAGLKAVVDTTGLIDDIISWTSVSDSGDDDDSVSGTARLGEDCTDTNSMACKSGAGQGNAGTGDDFDSCSETGYAEEGANYYEWARQYNDVKSMLSALRNIWSYSLYSGNSTCPQELFNEGGFSCNCYDACRIVKCMCDSCGFPCVVVTGSIYEGGHGWNSIKLDGEWKSFDLCYYSHLGESDGTNASNISK